MNDLKTIGQEFKNLIYISKEEIIEAEERFNNIIEKDGVINNLLSQKSSLTNVETIREDLMSIFLTPKNPASAISQKLSLLLVTYGGFTHPPGDVEGLNTDFIYQFENDELIIKESMSLILTISPYMGVLSSIVFVLKN